MIVYDIPKHFVKINEIDDSIVIDLSLAKGINNFHVPKLYMENIAYCTQKIAIKLKKANAIAKEKGFLICVKEAYRPYSVTKYLYDLNKDKKDLVASASGSFHNAGLALDVTLLDSNKKELEMPTAVHELVSKASVRNENALLLKQIMNEAGFGSLYSEWWHFQDIFDENGNKKSIKNEVLYDFKF
jgi:D-alanyl-D-alanine dipeptidase